MKFGPKLLVCIHTALVTVADDKKFLSFTSVNVVVVVIVVTIVIIVLVVVNLTVCFKRHPLVSSSAWGEFV